MPQLKFKPKDPLKVSIDEEQAVTYWMKQFNCSRELLADAVASVGTERADVQTYIQLLKGDTDAGGEVPVN